MDARSSEWTNPITAALASCEHARSFDFVELKDAFVRFFEDGEVSDELDSYFTKLAESVFVRPSSARTEPRPETGTGSTNSTPSRSSGSQASCSSTTTATRPQSAEQQKLRERRERNNEASRRSRAANKARFQRLIHDIQRLESENQQLNIWLREVQSAIQEAKDVLLQSQSNDPTTDDSV